MILSIRITGLADTVYETKYVEIPEDVKTIAPGAFSDCKNLKQIHVYGKDTE